MFLFLAPPTGRKLVVAGTQFTCFTRTKVQILTGPQFTCFTSTRVQTLTRLSAGLVVTGAGGDVRVHVC